MRIQTQLPKEETASTGPGTAALLPGIGRTESITTGIPKCKSSTSYPMARGIPGLGVLLRSDT
jgi:hypothetical protein